MAASSSPHRTDAVIVGAGPVGLFAVFEFGMLGMRCHVVDSLDEAGGQCAALYPEKPIYDIPGYPVIAAKDLVSRVKEQAAPFQPVYHLGRHVESLSGSSDGAWIVESDDGARIEARAVVIAAGVGAFGPNRPPIAGIADYERDPVFPDVQYAVKRRDDFRGKRVVIAGGGDSAVDWAVSLAEVAAHIFVVHRGAKFRAAPAGIAALERLAGEGKVELVIPFQLDRLDGDGRHINAVIVRDLDGNERRLAVDVLLPFFGLAQSLGPISGWGLNVDRNLIAVDPATCATNRPGIYAIGDIASYAGKLKLILSGFAEAALAAHAAYGIVFPGQALHFEYSTIKGIPTLR
ncbi:MAG: NAD(P)/FAD-dependent oxidoreductase [Rhodospirillales bacterium]|nr:NAD(P)/FAD-dependent oxidoreductase [Rhodospirillales bacterium]